MSKINYQEEMHCGLGRTYMLSFVLVTLIIGLALFIAVNTARAEVINLYTIAKIESNHNPLAINHLTNCIGLHQISAICLKEFNQYNHKQYSMNDMFNASKNTEVASWYLNKRIPQMLRAYGKDVNINNILHAYNAGISKVVKGIMPKETKNYILKYRELTKND